MWHILRVKKYQVALLIFAATAPVLVLFTNVSAPAPSLPGSLLNYSVSTVGVTINATYGANCSLAEMVDLYVNEIVAVKGGHVLSPVIHNRCYINSSADANFKNIGVCLFQHPMQEGASASQMFLRIWQANSDCSGYAETYNDFPLSGTILEDGGYTSARQTRMVTINQSNYSAKIDPHGGATFEFYSKRAISYSLPPGQYSNAIHPNTGAALQIAYFNGALDSLTASPCGGQGVYNPTQSGSACSYGSTGVGPGSSPDPNDPSSGLLVFCDGVLNNSCTSATNSLGLSMHRMMNWDYGPGIEVHHVLEQDWGPYNSKDQTYLSQNVTANSNFLEYDLQLQYRGPLPQFSAIQMPTFYLSNQYRQFYYPNENGGVSEVNIPFNTTGSDANNYGAPNGQLFNSFNSTSPSQSWIPNWISLANTAGGLNLFTNDYVTYAWFYAPDFVSDMMLYPTWAGIHVWETQLYHEIDTWNAQAITFQPGKNYHMKYVVFPYLYNEVITTRFGTMTVQATIAALNDEYQTLMAPPSTPKYFYYTSTSNDVLTGWPAANAIDQNNSTIYSSTLFSDNTNSHNTLLAAWLPQPETISSVSLVARMVNGVPTAFPTAYNVYVTTPTNSSWELAGLFFIQPEANGIATVKLPQLYYTYGVKVVPLGVGEDPAGNHYFQLADMYCQ